MELRISELERQEKYKLLIGGIIPRPIAWVTSHNPEGVVNAAPFSYFNVACIDPMMISIAVARKPGQVMKDTARNISETKEFVVNTVDVHNVALVNETSADFPADQSEVEALGLDLTPSQAIKVPRLALSRIHFECKLHQIVTLGEPAASDLIIGEVVHVHIDDSMYFNGKIDAEKFAPVSRLAGHTYATLGELFDHPRPVYDPKKY
ncbi:flavin reductase family protein [Brevibacillus laterosporus]|uniref:flavin reductase family protein n=1 Tax=Brevibacillus laterosporus TaxID=1465 RepID=UPI002654BD7F|nr:flavin reductase family protein [Brevibacillus laterosporus]MDN9010975.1 flavin reductase family protein [Brevibacillus laterosporus]MDO0941998.1 flavin reductase family protein [Brevibacillus laterosporus]